MTEQQQFDFAPLSELERVLAEQWAANERAETTETYAMYWAGFRDKEEWESQPRYERHRIVLMYETEQANLQWAIERWEPDYEVFYPGGEHKLVPPKPFHIRDFNQVNGHPVSQEQSDAFFARAQAMADQLSADWSANRPPSIFTYDPFLASHVSLILGRKVESILPPPEHRWNVPFVWQFVTALNQSGPAARQRDEAATSSGDEANEPAAKITDHVLH